MILSEQNSSRDLKGHGSREKNLMPGKTLLEFSEKKVFKNMNNIFLKNHLELTKEASWVILKG